MPIRLPLADHGRCRAAHLPAGRSVIHVDRIPGVPVTPGFGIAADQHFQTDAGCMAIPDFKGLVDS